MKIPGISIITSIVTDILDLMIPPRCHICGDTLMRSEEFLCHRCASTLPRTLYHSRKDNPMEMRFAGRFPFRRAAGHFFYTRGSSLASLIHDFKYRNFPSLARRLGNIMGEELKNVGFLNDVDAICPIPMHWSKKMRRGYNQTEYLAAGISEITKIPVSNDLKAIKRHSTQTHLSPLERQQNTQGIFTLRNAEKYQGKHVILLDDVCTTGATLTSAADTIMAQAPGAEISLLTLAVTF